MATRKALPTLNRCGWQFITPSPLIEEWISSHDNNHPLLDVGCAFGINIFEAAERNIPTIALDMEEGHLDSIRKNSTGKRESLVTCVFGSLPNKIPVPDNSISGILAAEVFHFLSGNDVEESLITLGRKLVEGGKLVFTVASDKYLAYVSSKERQASFYRDLSRGEKWPGIVKVDETFHNNVSRYIKSDDIKEFGKHVPEYIQVFSQSQMTDALERTGFKVKMSRYGRHPGNPDPDGLGQLEGINLQVVAEKKRLNHNV